jgi:hypothetical protein
MYSVASMHFGAVAGLPLVATLGRYGTWASGVAWLAVVVAMMAGLAMPKEPRSG